MTPKEAFKIGFLEKCAADGCTPEETMQRITHAKFMLKAAVVGATLKGISGFAKSLLPWMILTPPAAGLAGGALMAGASDDAYDADEARKREEIAEFQRAILRLQQLQQKQQSAGLA